MAVPISTRRWFAWPSRIALLLGIGALSVTGAEAAPSAQGQQPQSGADRFDGLRVWSEDGRIYLAEAGAAARELQLGDTVEARRLRALLQQDGGTKGGVRLDRMILAGGGGAGFDWVPPGQAAHPAGRAGKLPQSSRPRRPNDRARPVHPTSAAANDRSAEKD